MMLLFGPIRNLVYPPEAIITRDILHLLSLAVLNFMIHSINI